ncbi:MAG: cryptochrome/photolyase family protein [Pseudomonadales bacterium]
MLDTHPADTPLSIVWLERDLRLSDNPALFAARGTRMLLIFIEDTFNVQLHRTGSASRVWQHHSLQALQQETQGLNFYRGDPLEILLELCRRYNPVAVHWNRRYTPWQLRRDAHIAEQLQAAGWANSQFAGALLHEPWSALKSDASAYRVFTPYYRKLRSLPQRQPHSQVDGLQFYRDAQALSLDQLALLPDHPWAERLIANWQPGEAGAQRNLNRLVASALKGYSQQRDLPSEQVISKLSAHLQWGEISPAQILAALAQLPASDDSESFIRQLYWRDFSYYCLFHNPRMSVDNMRSQFDRFPWRTDAQQLSRWQRGQTGHPLVDAGMRELWQTGFIHNRVRMLCASFLVKHLCIDWRLGASWFWDCLIDADLACNSAGWQWVAGSGIDAAPYFRVFNPATQGEKFDPQGDYCRALVPELKTLPSKWLYRPWDAPVEVLKDAGVTLGESYPHPVISLENGRAQALNAYAQIKQTPSESRELAL